MSGDGWDDELEQDPHLYDPKTGFRLMLDEQGEVVGTSGITDG